MQESRILKANRIYRCLVILIRPIKGVVAYMSRPLKSLSETLEQEFTRSLNRELTKPEKELLEWIEQRQLYLVYGQMKTS